MSQGRSIGHEDRNANNARMRTLFLPGFTRAASAIKALLFILASEKKQRQQYIGLRQSKDGRKAETINLRQLTSLNHFLYSEEYLCR